MLTRVILVIILQYMQILNYYIVYLKLINFTYQLYCNKKTYLESSHQPDHRGSPCPQHSMKRCPLLSVPPWHELLSGPQLLFGRCWGSPGLFLSQSLAPNPESLFPHPALRGAGKVWWGGTKATLQRPHLVANLL